MTEVVTDWTLPTSAEELATYVERVGSIHLHNGSAGWRFVYIETGKCGTSDCFTLRLKRSSLTTETQRPANGGEEEA